MKPIPDNYSTTRSRKILAALILTGIVSVGSGLALIKSSVAAYKSPVPGIAKQSLKPNTTSDRLPRQVADAVLRNASEVSGLPIRALNIVTFKRTQWARGCEKPTFPYPCDPVLESGWEVMVGAGDNRWIYFSDDTGVSLKLSETGNQATLPNFVIAAIVLDASRWSGLPTETLRIVKAQPQTWGNRCLFAFGRLYCTAEADPVSGWEVTVDSGTQQWVYHVDDKATSVLLDRTVSLLPKAAEAIKKDAAKFSKSAIRIIDVQYRNDWNGSCEGVPNCTRPIAPGWEATLSDGRDIYVYRVKEDGSQFERQGENGNNNTLEVLPIPASELPAPLERNVVFREITSGGFTGRTFETVLLNDGRLIENLPVLGNANPPSRRVRRVSRQQVRKFQQLLEQQRFAQLANLNYHSKTACCDIPIYTFTTRDGTVWSNYIYHENLPSNLRAVFEAWNQLRGSARE